MGDGSGIPKDIAIKHGPLKKAAKNVVVMHCLPAHRGEEISEEVFEGMHSIVWEQSENKLHMHKAVLEAVLQNQ